MKKLKILKNARQPTAEIWNLRLELTITLKQYTKKHIESKRIDCISACTRYIIPNYLIYTRKEKGRFIESFQFLAIY